MNQQLLPIAQTLVNLDLVEKDKLVEISKNTSSAKEIIKAVFEQNLITSSALSKELSTQFGTPLFDIGALDPKHFPSDLIELKLVERHTVLPFYRHGKNLFVAMVDPTNKAALDEIKFYTGMLVIPIQVELNALENVINYLL